jgi:site-specific DNA-cytosine methylase
VAASELCGKYWAMPTTVEPLSVPVLETTGREKALPAPTTDFWWIIGAFLGDGWTRITSRRGYILFGVNPAKFALLTRALQAVGLHFTTSRERTTLRIQIASRSLARWLQEHFGHGAAGKSLPAWVFGMPEIDRRALYEGYAATDGHRSGGVTGINTVSRRLAVGLKLLAIGLGYSVTVGEIVPTRKECVIEGRVVAERPYYQTRCSDHARSAFRSGGHFFGLVRSVTSGSILRRVHNLEVEEDNSYTADGIVVHNCQAFSTAGKRKGLSDARGNLTLRFLELVRDLSPEWVVWENVPGVLTLDKGRVFGRILDLFEEAGYLPECDVLDAQYFGVPQRRRRVFVVARKADTFFRRRSDETDAVLAQLFAEACAAFLRSPQPAGRLQHRWLILNRLARDEWPGLGDPDLAAVAEAAGEGKASIDHHGASSRALLTLSGLVPTTTPYAAGAAAEILKAGTEYAKHARRAVRQGAEWARGFLAAWPARRQALEELLAHLDPGPEDAGKLPAEPQGQGRHPPASGEARPETPRPAAAGTGAVTFQVPTADPAFCVSPARGTGDAHGQGWNSNHVIEGTFAFSCKDSGGDAGPTCPTLRAMGHTTTHANGGGQAGVVYPEDAVCIHADALCRTGDAHTPSPDAEGRPRLRPPGLGVCEGSSFALAASGPHAVAFRPPQDEQTDGDGRLVAAFGGNNTAGPIEVATARSAHGGPHGRLDFETDTFIVEVVPIAPSCQQGGTVVIEAQTVCLGSDPIVSEGVAQPVTTRNDDPGVVAYQCHGNNVGPMGTLRSGDGGLTSGVPFVVQSQPFVVNAAESCARESHARPSEVARCLDSSGGFAANPGGTVVVDAVCVTGDRTHALTSEGADASEDGTGRGTPLAAYSNPLPLYDSHDYNQDRIYSPDGVAPAVTASDSAGARNFLVPDRSGGEVRLVIRRFTPRETERLQGFPDDHTLIPHGTNRRADLDEWIEYLTGQREGLSREQARRLASDGPRYKAVGNSMAVPCIRWIGEKIATADRRTRGYDSRREQPTEGE